MEYIDTAIETAGAVPRDMLLCAVEHMGEILFDIKTLDEAVFREFSDYSLEHVLDNLKALCAMGKKVRIRCPIIPGVNQKEEFIRGVIDIARENKIGRIDLLPFHQLGSYKYRTIGKEYALGHLKTMAKEEADSFKNMIQQEGITCVVGG